jgi:hypothetical protein
VWSAGEVSRPRPDAPATLGETTRSDPRITPTTAPKEALLADVTTTSDAEVIVDPELLGGVTEVPRRAWLAELSRPTEVWLTGLHWAIVSDVDQ